MDEKQIKRKLEDDGLRVADLAKHLASDFGVKETSADNMLRELIAGRRWYPVYAKWLQQNYFITVNKPAWLLPVRERLMKKAA
ncbi:MAG: hypothetical protein IPM50_02735 [Acidobacteriota bacterium]|nr:MAG: hypothetical protein IPM50_02735 [Acidobacteriota bacterium]